MNSTESYHISAFEMAIVFIGFILGIGILMLPRVLVEAAGTADGWISILISGGFAMVFVALMVHLSKNYPGQSLFQYMSETTVGKWISIILFVLFFIYFLNVLGFQIRLLTIILRMYLLDRTPPEATVILILLGVAYAAKKGVQGVVHLTLLYFPFILLVYLFLLIFNIGNVSMDAFRPVLSEGIMPVIHGLEPTIFSFLGVELFFFWSKYVQAKNVRALPLNMALVMITMFYLLTVMFTMGVFTVNVTKIITFPAIELAKEIEVLEGIIERYEPLMLAVWILVIFNTMAILMLLLVQMTTQRLKKNKKTWVLGGIMALTYIIVFIPNSIDEVFTVGEWCSYLGISLNAVTLLLGYLFVFIRSRKHRYTSHEGVSK
ncbi:GerAB/ArcD/ProY family transporter [Halalkalibacterium halodurans]|uniref:GerAB/ArcD/ProY family transporter n=1 Tax=Halalkalibacterium halodurans TaxID=86665 RepID=UPI002AAA25DD|nr:GerAB/ArcD/ProY family transporter [Halalkalibacterium halodurans]MDY7221828.1 GerAB/ArcD/ProY family transporter [Halalkalibacterium halodurans]MDY7241104.1 GerAB/ArcD/ProY family transporter [Halalkalibacterium halodurans]